MSDAPFCVVQLCLGSLPIPTAASIQIDHMRHKQKSLHLLSLCLCLCLCVCVCVFVRRMHSRTLIGQIIIASIKSVHILYLVGPRGSRALQCVNVGVCVRERGEMCVYHYYHSGLLKPYPNNSLIKQVCLDDLHYPIYILFSVHYYLVSILLCTLYSVYTII